MLKAISTDHDYVVLVQAIILRSSHKWIFPLMARRHYVAASVLDL